ncbi:MAG: hypothetical protein AAF467_10050 [Actinomycetota bacterium]
MSEHYIAWDGRQYPWPPPDNWYLADDGRYWAPGTGPDPGAGVGLGIGAEPRHEPTAQLAKVQIRNTPTEATVPPPRRGSGALIALLSVLGLVAVVLIAGVAFLMLGSDDADTAAVDVAAPTTESDNAAAEATDADSDANADADANADGAAEATASPSTTLLTSDPRVADFRARLAANELSAESLGDAEIEQFGMDFCALAADVDDGAMYASVRDEAVAGSSFSDLDAEELAFLIDSAVATFCPEHAQRLGIAT